MQNEYLEHIKPYLNLYKQLEPIATNIPYRIEPLLNIKCVVFDIYGTLIVSASGDLDKSTVSVSNLTKALNAANILWNSSQHEEKHGKELLSLFHKEVENQHNQLRKNGHPYPEVDIILVWQHCIESALKRKWIESNENPDLKLLTVVFEILSNPVWPMPEMNKTIEALKAKNIPLGIVSNAQFYTPIIMNKFISDKITEQENIDPFDHDISIYSYKLLRSKPDTFLFEQLKKQLDTKYGIKPEQALFVGNDMLKDIWTAKQLGFKTALFAGDKRSLRMREDDERCKGLKPDIVIKELPELLNII